jgi:ribonuclease HI
METYYVVKKGFKTGIFKTWPECKSAVDGFSGPIFKKFNSFIEASDYFKAGFQKSRAQTNTEAGFQKSRAQTNTEAGFQKSDLKRSELEGTIGSFDINMEKIKPLITNIKSSQYSDELNYNVDKWNIIENEIYIFTDGSSRKSKEYFNSGVGVYIGYQCTNIKEQYNNKTNNQCELMGMDYAFKLIVRYYRELAKIGKIIKIVSDSEYSIKSCSVWLTTWKTNNWKTSKGEDVKNRDIIESIDGSMLRIKLINSKSPTEQKIKVKLIHINSHQPCPDSNDKIAFNIWFGNYVADGLAQNTI